MSFRKTLLFTLILAAITAFYYLYEIRGGSIRLARSKAEQELFKVKAETLTGINLNNTKGHFAFTKNGEEWYLQEPVPTPGDTQTVSDLVRAVTGAQKGRAIEENPKDLTLYGLKPPKTVVSFQGKGKSNVPLPLLLGDPNPSGTEVYAQLEGKPAVFLLDMAIQSALDKGLFEYRDKRLLPFKTSDVTQILWNRGNLKLTTGKDKNGSWSLVEPFKSPADSQKIEDILFRLGQTQVKEFITPGKKNVSQFGTDKPVVTLVLKREKKPDLNLSFGRHLEKEKDVYAWRGGEQSVLRVEDIVLKDMPETLTSIRDLTVFKADQDHVLKVEWKKADGSTFLLDKTMKDGSEDWMIEKPVVAPAERSEAYGLLWDLHDTKLERFVSDTPKDLSPYGLNAPQWIVTLWQQREEKPQVLKIGKVRSGANGYYAMVSYSPSVFLLSNASFKRLWRNQEDLRERKLLDFDTEKISKVELRYQTTAVTLAKNGKRWQMLAPEKADIAGPKMIDLLWGVKDLKFKKEVSHQVKELDSFGLKNPQFQITLWDDKGKKLPMLTVGSKLPDTDEYYLSKEPFTSVYIVSLDLLNKLPKGPRDLLF
ncbi:MAG TPA: DUF4340 domain-containing protein [bacterium]|nr:DUF4340 domain-containing protein [bacterium]